MSSSEEIGIRLTLQGAGAVASQLGGVQRQVQAVGQSADDAGNGADRLAAAIGRIGHYGALVGTLGVLQAAGRALFEASAAAERLATQLDFATGGAGAREMAFVSGLANRLGLDLQGAAKAYGMLAAAARGTSMEGKGARQVFEAVSKAAAAMGLSADETSGALLALQQMISKGKVSSEELTGQLGERLPGAFQIAARAMGVTTVELSKMLEQGQVLSEDFLPKFARQLEQELGDAAEKSADRLDAAVARMGNAWSSLKRAVGDSGISRGIANSMGVLTNDMKAVSEAMDRARNQGGGFLRQMNDGLGMIIGRAVGLGMVNRDFMTLEQAVADATATIKRLDEQEQRFGKLSIYSMSERAAAARDLARANRELAASGGQEQGAGGGRGLVNPQTVGQQLAAQEQAAERLAALRLKISGVDKDYVEAMSQLAKDRAAGLIGEKEYAEVLGLQQAALLKKTGATQKASEAEKAAAEEAKKRQALLMGAIGLDTDYLETLERLQKMRAKGEISEDRYVAAVEKLIGSQAAAKQLTEEYKKEQKELGEAMGAVTAHAAKADAQLYATVDSLAAALKEQQERNEAIGLEGAALTELEHRRALANIALLEERLRMEELAGTSPERLAALRQEIELQRQLADARYGGARKQVDADMQRQVRDEWQRTTEQIGQSLSDALMQGGKSAWEYIKGLFRSTVLRPVIQAVVNPAVSSFMGLLGMASPASATAPQISGTAGLGQYLQLASLGSSASLGGMIAAAGNTLGMGSLSAFGTGMGLTGAQAAAASSAYGAAGMASTGTALSAGASAAAAIPVVGAIIAGMLANGSLHDRGWKFDTSSMNGLSRHVFKNSGYEAMNKALDRMFGAKTAAMLTGSALTQRFFGRKAPQVKASGIEGTFGNDDFTGNTWADIEAKGGYFRKTKRWTETGALDAGMDHALSSTFGALRRQISGLAQSLSLPTEQIAGYTRHIRLAFGSDEAANQKQIEELFAGMTEDMANAAMRGFEWAIRGGEKASDALKRLGGSIEAVNPMLRLLGVRMLDVNVWGGDAASALADLMGGLEGFTSATSAYYQAFFSEEERLAKTTDSVREGMAALGMAMPGTRAEFRRLVEAQDLHTDAGRRAYAALMQMAPAFDAVAAAA
ncbi:tape measure protein, partial [Caldimonas tepidiphila]|uniref:tape measure protein n=1 Tax=Caldimonas tepidiphila TaxID=2315841 RepID=UPI0013006B35